MTKMRATVACLLVLLSGCSSPNVTVNNVIVTGDGGSVVSDAGVVETGQQDGGDDAEGVVLDSGLDAPITIDAAGEDANIPDGGTTDAPVLVPHDSGPDAPSPDKVGIWCNTQSLGLVIGCDGYGGMFGGYTVETAEYTCGPDGTGTATCIPGELCQAVVPAGGVNHYYPGVCQ